MYHAARHENAAFDRVGRATVEAPADCREQSVAGHGSHRACIHEGETSGAVGRLHIALRKTCLPESRSLLVASDTADGDRSSQQAFRCLAKISSAVAKFREQRPRYVEERKHLLAPAERAKIEQHGARGVRHIGGMNESSGEAEDEPAVDRAEGKFAAPGAKPSSGYMIEQPRELGRGEIRIDDEPRTGGDKRLAAAFLERATAVSRATVLPDDRVMKGSAGRALPKHRGLALVGSPDRGNVPWRDTAGDDVAAGENRPPDFLGIMLDPTVGGIDLSGIMAQTPPPPGHGS